MILVEIENAVINIMNREINSAVFSQKELDTTDEIVIEYIEKLVKKFLNSECLTFEIEESEPAQYLISKEDSFIKIAESMTQYYFEAIKTWAEIPEGDLLFFRLKDEIGNEYAGMIKLDYTAKYIHLIDYDDDNVVTNKIGKNKAILPAPTQGASCGIIVKNKQACFVHEKTYQDVQGTWSFVERILELKQKKTKVSENVAKVKKSLKSVSKKYDIEEYEAVMDAQKAIYKSIDEDSSINNEQLAQQVFGDNVQAKQDFMEDLDKKGVAPKIVVDANAPVFERKYQKQKLKLDNGIEIVVPVDLLKNRDYIEFKNNTDGSLSVIIKNIENIKNNF